MVCGACGAANAPGDAFCGNCGAFLEWSDGAGEAAVAAEVERPLTPEPESAPVAAVEAAPEPESAPEPAPPAEFAPHLELAPVPAPAPGPVPAPAIEPAPPPTAPLSPEPTPGLVPSSAPAPSGPTCPSCGLANDPGRTFCRRCGTRLPATPAAGTAPVTAPVATPVAAARARPAPVSPPPIAAAAPTAQPPPPVAAAITRVEPVPTPAMRSRPAAAAGPRPGQGRFLIIGAGIVVVALVAVGAFALFGGGSGGAAPTIAPSPAPTGAPPPAETPPPSEEPSLEPTAPAETPPAETPPPTPAPTAPTGPAIGITVLGADASTSANDKSAPAKAHDGSPATAWLEGAKDVEGQWIEMRIPPTAVTRLSFSAGVQASRAAYDGNPRPRNVTISFDGGQPIPLTLTDTFGAQRVDIPAELGITGAQAIRITIIDAYPAKKTSYKGSPTQTVGFSEIRVFGIPAGP